MKNNTVAVSESEMVVSAGFTTKPNVRELTAEEAAEIINSLYDRHFYRVTGNGGVDVYFGRHPEYGLMYLVEPPSGNFLLLPFAS